MNGNQRWLFRVDSYRPAGETINPSEYDVERVNSAAAKTFVLSHHYSGSFPAARYCFGLFHRAELVGVAVFSQPSNNRTITKAFPSLCSHLEGVELGRFVLLDRVPANGETFFLGRCRRLLRNAETTQPKKWDASLLGEWAGVRAIVSFSDPVPRSTSDGGLILPGHVGTIYQASNAVYVGRGKRSTLALLPDGTVFSPRAKAKIRARARGESSRGKAQGWQYAVRLLRAQGACAPGRDLGAWLDRELARLARPLIHGGNHKFCWALDKRLRRDLPKVDPRRYPKHTDAMRFRMAARVT